MTTFIQLPERLPPDLPCNFAEYSRLAFSFNLIAARTSTDDAADSLWLEVFEAFLHYFPGDAKLFFVGAAISPAIRMEIQRLKLDDLVCIFADPSAKDWQLLINTGDLLVWLDQCPDQALLKLARDAGIALLARTARSDESAHDESILVLKPEASAREMAAAAALLAMEPDLRRSLRARASAGVDYTASSWLLDGPFDSSYSLAIVNRELGLALERAGHKIGFTDPEIQQGRPVNDDFLGAYQTVLARAVKPGMLPLPGIRLRNNYPPVVTDMRSGINVLSNYAWEESAFPAQYTGEFNNRLDLITVTSPLVKKILRDNGVKRPIAVVGNGVDHLLAVEPEKFKRPSAKSFYFLHVSSCFPRKGLDVLLAAYGRAFSAADDVALIIKTFPNPHNEAEHLLAGCRAGQADFPEMVLINRDMNDRQMAGLYQACDAFVLATRAEGFGMPLAEAMLADLPVIVTGFGGHRFFCDETTSWLVDYQFEAAESHLGLFNSAWAEPDVDALVQHMLSVYRSTPEQRRIKTETARRRVQELFTWDRVATLTRQAIDQLAEAPMLPDEKQIGWISSWNCRCGIATYSEHLLCRIPQRRITVFANRNAEPLATDGDHVVRCWSTDSANIKPLQQAIMEEGCQIVVIQYNYGFMPLKVLEQLLKWLQQAGIQTYLTLHNTQPPKAGRSLAEIGGALRFASRVLVHSIDDLNRLKTAGIVNNVCLFPHGVYPSPAVADDALRLKVGLLGKRVIASFGFLLPHKGIKELIESFAVLCQQHDTLHLLLVNALFPDVKSYDEQEACLALIEQLGLTDKVTMLNDFLPDHETLTLLSLAEVIVYPYQFTQESASGAVRMGIAARRPVLVTPLGIFSDVEKAVHFLPGCSPEAITEGINGMLKQLEDDGRRSEIEAHADAWRNAHQWEHLSERLLNLIDGEANWLGF